jgi:peroxiredoxin
MIQVLTTFLFVSFMATSSAFSQNCFESCHQNLKQSKLPFIEANEKIISELTGCQAPDFDVTTMDGERLKLKDLKGKIVVMNFWYTSCAPCIAEMPALNRLVNEYSKSDVIFISFVREQEDEATTKQLLIKTKFDYKVVSGKYPMTDKFCVISGWPMNIVLDKNGIVRRIFTGGYVDNRAETHAYNAMKPTIDQYLSVK